MKNIVFLSLLCMSSIAGAAAVKKDTKISDLICKCSVYHQNANRISLAFDEPEIMFDRIDFDPSTEDRIIYTRIKGNKAELADGFKPAAPLRYGKLKARIVQQWIEKQKNGVAEIDERTTVTYCPPFIKHAAQICYLNTKTRCSAQEFLRLEKDSRGWFGKVDPKKVIVGNSDL